VLSVLKAANIMNDLAKLEVTFGNFVLEHMLMEGMCTDKAQNSVTYGAPIIRFSD
jgi:hypothetical protein